MYLNKNPEQLAQDDDFELEPAPKPKYLKEIKTTNEILWNFSDSIPPLNALAAKAISDHQIKTQRCFGDDIAKWYPKIGYVLKVFFSIDENFESIPDCFEEYIRREPWNNKPVFVYYFTQSSTPGKDSNASEAIETKKIFVRRIFNLSKDNQKTLDLMELVKGEIDQHLNSGQEVYLPESQRPFQGTDFVQFFSKGLFGR